MHRRCVIVLATAALFGCQHEATTRVSAPLVPSQSVMKAPTTEETLEFFNHLSGRLDVQLSEPPHQVSERIVNLVAPPTARLKNVKLRMEVFVHNGDAITFRELRAEEWNWVAIRAPRMRMRGWGKNVVEHIAPNSESFTVRDLTNAVEETERKTRGSSEWLDGIDVHHTFFEGIHLEEDGVWSIYWGS